MMYRFLGKAALIATALWLAPAAMLDAQRKPADDPRLAKLKTEVAGEIEKMSVFTQQMVDQIFSFGELGFQEEETSKYLKKVLRDNGFTIQEGVAGIPTAWWGVWGSGKPVIALGSDIDGIPQASQKPGVAYHDPLVQGAPGHGEGHNSGQAVNITAAIAIKRIMERDKIPGTIRIWPGVAEELVGTKAYFVREGLFKDVDICLFSHVGSNLGTSWGQGHGNGLISVEFKFQGTAAHSAGAPWRGKSALDAVELMNIGWNYRREHLRPNHRSHYVIKDGGDQPNVVPSTASVWYYFREMDYEHVMELFEFGKQIAEGAAMMTGTKLVSTRILGTAWPGHFNKTIAEAMTENAKLVGLPKWDENDQTLARSLQKELGSNVTGLDTALTALDGHVPEDQRRGGGSDDIGDISWNVPTVTLRFPSNIPNLPGHHWANAIAMATPIAHKGATAGAKVQAMTMLDILLKPKVITDAWDYFNTVQTKDRKYKAFIGPNDKPAIELNAGIMQKYREEMRKYYFDPTKYKTYLEQLGIKYPTVKATTSTSP
jgi:aminobenzoyl-glutamate utilization protein B